MPWQLVTYGFLHGDLMHIAFNMFALWMSGRELELMMGVRRFLTYFLTCVIGAGIIQLIVAGTQGGLYPTVGASGGVFGILLAYGLAFPNRMIMLLFPPIPMKAKYFVLVFGLLELYLGVSGNAPGVANFAHLGGMLFGFLLLRYWSRSRRRG
jgi:membrane associated rhomboid family serine protease